MFKKLFFASVMCFVFLFVVSSANASVEGSWVVNSRAKDKLTIEGRSKVLSSNVAEELTFSPNGDFTDYSEGIYITGTWKEKKNNFTVLFDMAAYGALLESAFASDGIYATVTVTELIATGTVGRNTIRGKSTLKAQIFFPYSGLQGTYTGTANFAGARTAVSGDESAGSEVSESLKAAVRELVAKSLSSLGR